MSYANTPVFLHSASRKFKCDVCIDRRRICNAKLDSLVRCDICVKRNVDCTFQKFDPSLPTRTAPVGPPRACASPGISSSDDNHPEFDTPPQSMNGLLKAQDNPRSPSSQKYPACRECQTRKRKCDSVGTNRRPCSSCKLFGRKCISSTIQYTKGRKRGPDFLYIEDRGLASSKRNMIQQSEQAKKVKSVWESEPECNAASRSSTHNETTTSQPITLTSVTESPEISLGHPTSADPLSAESSRQLVGIRRGAGNAASHTCFQQFILLEENGVEPLEQLCLQQTDADSDGRSEKFEEKTAMRETSSPDPTDLQRLNNIIKRYPARFTFSIELLESRENLIKDPTYVREEIKKLEEKISEYDEVLRCGYPSFGSHQRLSHRSPLTQLKDIVKESSRESAPRSEILLLLRGMFDVAPWERFIDHIRSLSSDVQCLKLSPIICASLAFLLREEIFSAKVHEESESSMLARRRSFQDLFGPLHDKIELYWRLRELEEDSFNQRLAARAIELAESFHSRLNSLLPGPQAKDDITRGKCIDMLHRIAMASLRLAALLQAQTGKFEFPWPLPGAPFDPELLQPNDIQIFDFRDMSDEIKRKQVVTLTLMFGVQKKRDLNTYTYSPATIIARRPYTDFAANVNS